MYRNIIDYDLIKSNDKVNFLDEIKAMIENGWQPMKTAIVLQDHTGQMLFYQTMVKFEDEDEDESED